MKSFFTGLSFIFLITFLLVAYQNCGVSTRNLDSSLDDRVYKFSQPLVDGSDDSLVIEGLGQQLNSELEQLSLPVPASQEAVTGWFSSSSGCKNALGGDRQACLQNLISSYYSIMAEHFGYSILNSPNCSLAKKTVSGRAHIDVTCQYDPSRLGQFFVHLDTCAPQADGGVTAIHAFEKSRHYQRTTTNLEPIAGAPREISVLAQDVMGEPFTDTCGNLHTVEDEGITFLL